MTCQEDYPDELLQKKMKKWGIITEIDATMKSGMITPPQQETPFLLQNWLEDRFQHTILTRILSERLLTSISGKETIVEKLNLLESNCNQLKQRLQELETRFEGTKTLTKADLIYEKYRSRIEAENFGKIIAIDVDSEEIAGIGDSIIDAFKDAKKHSDKETFAYRRVGFAYVHRI